MPKSLARLMPGLIGGVTSPGDAAAPANDSRKARAWIMGFLEGAAQLTVVRDDC